MKKMIILALLVSTTMISCAQETACNRTVYLKSFEQQLPKEICLPDGYMVREILSDTVDVSGDGRVDFVAKLQKINAEDGDTTLVVLYAQQENGTYKEWATFNNLFPIYLKDYDFDYENEMARKDTSFFMQLRQRYEYPELSDVYFEQNTIIVKFNTGGGGGILLHFTFDKEINSWKLTKQVDWFGTWGRIESTPDYGTFIPKNQYDIREFNMLDYLH